MHHSLFQFWNNWYFIAFTYWPSELKLDIKLDFIRIELRSFPTYSKSIGLYSFHLRFRQIPFFDPCSIRFRSKLDLCYVPITPPIEILSRLSENISSFCIRFMSLYSEFAEASYWLKIIFILHHIFSIQAIIASECQTTARKHTKNQ